MKRIDSINARPNVNGAGKTGFHDNNDISGQDATYLTPDWLNHIQEELCALLEKNGRILNAGQRDQLFQLLATEDDVLALAAAVQQKLDTEKTQREAADGVLQGNIDFVQANLSNERTERINADNNKYDKTGGTINGNVHIDGGLTFGSKIANPTTSVTSLPNGFRLQTGFIAYEDMTVITGTNTDERYYNVVFPEPFETACISVVSTICIDVLAINNDTWAQVFNVTNIGVTVLNQTTNLDSSSRRPFKGIYWQAIGY